MYYINIYSSEREERERKKRRLAEELDNCIRLQNQWRAIQKFIEMEEDRLIEECQIQRRRLSHMQQQERKEKAEKLASIRQKLQKALEVEEVFQYLFHNVNIVLNALINSAGVAKEKNYGSSMGARREKIWTRKSKKNWIK